MKQNTIAAIILTFNEEQHISRCITSLKGTVDDIFVVDSFSTDNTVEIAKKLGVKVFQNSFVNQAVQFNWALENCNVKSDWILRVDADEYLRNKHNIDLSNYLSELSSNINGLLINRKIVFMNRPLLYGGWYPKFNLRLFKNGYGECENRWMDEHIVLSEGGIATVELELVDENLNNLSWWIQKHNNYSTREAMDFYLKKDRNTRDVEPNLFGTEAEKKRWLKNKYNTIPLFVRPFMNFIYRYFIMFGFLDGKSGFVWHVLQGFWYRFLVDAKIYELKLKFNHDEKKIVEHIKEKYQIK